MDQESIDTLTEQGTVQEIKEWQAIMDHLLSLPVEGQGELPMIPVDARAAEVRAIKAGWSDLDVFRAFSQAPRMSAWVRSGNRGACAMRPHWSPQAVSEWLLVS